MRLYLVQAPTPYYSEVFAHGVKLAESFAINPQWAEMQAGLTAEQTRIIADMADATSASISEG